MAETKIIYCPRCNRKVTSYDGRSKINPLGRCKKCNKQIIYDIQTSEIKLMDIPPRTTSSGLTFY